MLCGGCCWCSDCEGTLCRSPIALLRWLRRRRKSSGPARPTGRTASGRGSATMSVSGSGSATETETGIGTTCGSGTGTGSATETGTELGSGTGIEAPPTTPASAQSATETAEMLTVGLTGRCGCRFNHHALPCTLQAAHATARLPPRLLFTYFVAASLTHLDPCVNRSGDTQGEGEGRRGAPEASKAREVQLRCC